MCNNVKTLCLIQANNKLMVLSCPFPTQAPDGKAGIAGSLGDSFKIMCPVTIRCSDACGQVILIVTRKKFVVKTLDLLPTFQSNPLDKEGPPPLAGTLLEQAGPDRIKVIINKQSIQGTVLCSNPQRIHAWHRIRYPNQSNQRTNHHKNINS
jgi:hypothetical protein